MILSSETVLRLILYMLTLVIMIGCLYCVRLQRSDMMRMQSSVPIWDGRHHPEDRSIYGMVTPTIAPELTRHPLLEPDNSRNTGTKKHAWFDSHV